MLEQVFKLTEGNEKIVERLLEDEYIHYFHMLFENGDGMPKHTSNANAYMTIIRGTMSIDISEQGIHEYQAGSMVKVPINTEMSVQNLHDETLELIIVKAPAPKE